MTDTLQSGAGSAQIPTWEDRAVKRTRGNVKAADLCYRDWPNLVLDELLDLRAALARRATAPHAAIEQDISHVMAPFAPPASQHEAGVSAWVSVDDDRKPDFRKPVLLFVRTATHGEDDNGHSYTTEGEEIAMGEYVDCFGAPDFDCYTSPMSDSDWITHWMPLPPAPEQSNTAGAARQGGDTNNESANSLATQPTGNAEQGEQK